MEKEWLTIEQFGELVQKPADRIRTLCRQAQAQGKYTEEIVKIGRDWRINARILKQGGINV